MESTRSDIEKLKDENFCLQFELETMANLVIRGEAERWLPGFIWKQIEAEHASRYELAVKYAEGKKILDLACGSGYGSYLLAKMGNAEEVQAYDIDQKAIDYGNIRYAHGKIKRAIADAELFISQNYFDMIVSFETIEHLNNREKFLQNIHDSLKQGGLFFVSTPIVEMTHVNSQNPHHKIEWSFEDFHNLIRHHFDIKEVYVQSVKLKSRTRPLLLRLVSKIIRTILDKSETIAPPNPQPILFTNQYDTTKIVEGYQIIICQKK